MKPVRRRALAATIGIVVAALVVWLATGKDEPASEPVQAASPPSPVDGPKRAAAGAARPAGASTPQTAEAPPVADRERERERLQLVLARTRRTLEDYRAATRYPPGSRPARDEPDQMEPAAPERKMSMDEDGAFNLVLGQDRVFVAGGEAVTFFLRCEDRHGTPLSCEIAPGSAHESPHVDGALELATVPVPFHDDGKDGDAAANDRTFSARFAPGRAGFLASSGTVRVDVSAKAGSAARAAFFDVLYTGSPPARFTGKVKELVEQGSLQLDVGMEVERAGRYVVTGRVDDAAGKPFAWLEFNEELPEGMQAARLTVFGKLILDERPAFPLRLRDVEGFLLKEAGDPDRELMVARLGPVHTTRTYAPDVFSPDEWTSEQRDRYLQEFGKDVDTVEQEIDALDGPR